MLKVFEATNHAEANLVCGLLQAEGIEAEVRGDTLFAILGAGTQIPGTLPAVWVARPEDAARARDLAARFQQGEVANAGDGWTCPACSERHESQFTACWKCGAEQPR